MHQSGIDNPPLKKIWEVSLTQQERDLYKDQKRDYILIKAGPEYEQIVFNAYRQGIVGYEIVSIEIVYNSHTEKAFEAHSHKLQKRAGNPAFMPKWPNKCASPEETKWRGDVVKKWQSFSVQDTSCPDVYILGSWHGTNPDIVGSIFETGFANLATTDSGFFGKGLYFSREAEYAYRVYSHGEGKNRGQLGNGGILLFNWVLAYSIYPVIHGDMDKLKEKGNHQNHDAHFIPIVPRSAHDFYETVYFPCQSQYQDAVFHELAVFESAAALPRCLVAVAPVGLNLKSLPTNTLNPMLLYQQGMAYRKGQDFKKALECFEQLAKLNFPLGLLELGWCYRKGEGIQQNVNAAANCFGQAANLGLASAIHELGWCYKRGEGVPKDETQAAIHFEKAAEKGLPGAAFDTGCHYFSGIGVEKNRARAAYYFKQAADKGISKAQMRYAECCMNGDGVSKNHDKAVKYYQLAAKQGEKSAEEHLITLYSAQLTKLKQGQSRYILLPQPQQQNQQKKSDLPQKTHNSLNSDQGRNLKLN